MSRLYSRIAGVGTYLPDRVVTNDELATFVDTSHEWIIERTGIEQRYVIADDQSTSDLALAAAKQALLDANLSATELDLIIVATATADHAFPSVASQVQCDLGCSGVPAFDVQAACAGFLYALSTADNFIRAGQAKKVLVIGAEAFTRLLDWNDRTTCVLFGDGAGAFVLSADEETGILSTDLHAEGKHKELLWVPKGPGANEQLAAEGAFIKMKGSDVFKVAVAELSNSVGQTLSKNNYDTDDLDWLVPHQANKRILNAVAKRIKLSEDKVIVTVDKHANTSSASVPLAFAEGVRDGRIQRGHLCLLEAFGGGFVWGSALLRY